jgi:hypothetical protein
MGANDFVPKGQTIWATMGIYLKATAGDLRGPGLPASGPCLHSYLHDSAASMARAGGRGHGEGEITDHGVRRVVPCRDAWSPAFRSVGSRKGTTMQYQGLDLLNGERHAVAKVGNRAQPPRKVRKEGSVVPSDHGCVSGSDRLTSASIALRRGPTWSGPVW